MAVCGLTPKDGYFVLYDHPVEDSNSWVARTDDLVVDSLSFLWAGCFAVDAVVISLAMIIIARAHRRNGSKNHQFSVSRSRE